MRKSLILLLALSIAGNAMAQEHQLYAAGHFPSGHLYVESDLEGLVGQALPDPSYLIGKFAFLGISNGSYTFAPLERVTSPKARSLVLISVTFLEIHLQD